MKKSDLVLGLIIGEVIALLSLSILKNLKSVFEPLVLSAGFDFQIVYWVWPIILPILTVAGLVIAYYIGKKIHVIWEVAKFVLVGALNTFVDIGVLNLLIFISGFASGLYYSIFKGISFLVAAINSYLWNKYWTFSSNEEEDLTKKGKEFGKFIIISGIGFLINVTAASVMVNIIGPSLEIQSNLLANLGGIVAAFCSMTWNFLGYKFVVFKK